MNHVQTMALWCWAGAALVMLTACPEPGELDVGQWPERNGSVDVDGGGTGGGTGDSTLGMGDVAADAMGGTCIPTSEFFVTSIWDPFMGSTCMACHAVDGIGAIGSALVLVPLDDEGALDTNLGVLREVAMREMDGESLLLLKPRGELSHGGGPVVPEGTESYDALVELVDRLANPRSCDGMSTDRDTGVSMDTSQPPMDTAMAEEDIAPDLPSQPESQEWLFEGEGNDVQATTGQASNNGYNLWSNGELTATVEVPADGTYTIRARVWGQQCCDGLARMALLLDGQRVLEHDVTAENASQAELVEHQMQLTAARHTIGVEFLNDFFDQPSGQDRNLLVDWISLEGPNP